MAAKKKKSSNTKKEVQKFTAVKLVVHRATESEEFPGTYRYVIAGMLVTSKPLANIPTDNIKSLLLEGVEAGEDGIFPASAFRDALGTLTVRENPVQGLSADQNLIALKKL